MEAGDYVRLKGKTYSWRRLLKEVGLTWEPLERLWHGRLEPKGRYALPSLRRGVKCGELKLMSD